MVLSCLLCICSQYLPLIILREINYNALTNHWLTNKSKQSQTFSDRWNKWSKLPKFKLNVWQPSTSRIFAEDFHFLIITHACPLLGEHRTRLLYWLVWLHDPDLINIQSGVVVFLKSKLTTNILPCLAAHILKSF